MASLLPCIIGFVTFTSYDTVRECCRRALAATDRPLTAADIADQINTTPAQASKALRELERRGAAVRERQAGRPGQRGGRTPDAWRAR